MANPLGYVNGVDNATVVQVSTDAQFTAAEVAADASSGPYVIEVADNTGTGRYTVAPAPTISGQSNTNRIVYVNQTGSDPVFVKMPVLSNVSYVTVYGLRIDGINNQTADAPGLITTDGFQVLGSTFCTVQNCKIYKIYEDGIRLDTSNYCIIKDNEIWREGHHKTSPTGAHASDGEGLIVVDSSYNWITGNVFHETGHNAINLRQNVNNGCRYNVVEYNYLQPRWTEGVMDNTSYRAAVIARSNGNLTDQHNVFQYNFIVDASDNYLGLDAAKVFKTQGESNIIRFNVAINCASSQGPGGAGQANDQTHNNRVYNNTLGNSSSGVSEATSYENDDPAYLSDNEWMNNIIWPCAYSSTDLVFAAGYYVQLADGQFPAEDFSFHDNIVGNETDTPVTAEFRVEGSNRTLAYVEDGGTGWPDNYYNNTKSAPGFVNSIPFTSPAIPSVGSANITALFDIVEIDDSGSAWNSNAALTVTADANQGGGNTIVVGDSLWFHPPLIHGGTTVVAGDKITIGGTTATDGSPATITAIDYPNNRITIDKTIAWALGASVKLVNTPHKGAWQSSAATVQANDDSGYTCIQTGSPSQVALNTIHPTGDKVSDNDTGFDGVSVVITAVDATGSLGGSFAINGTTDDLLYTQPADTSGYETVSYTITGGTTANVEIYIQPTSVGGDDTTEVEDNFTGEVADAYIEDHTVDTTNLPTGGYAVSTIETITVSEANDNVTFASSDEWFVKDVVSSGSYQDGYVELEIYPNADTNNRLGPIFRANVGNTAGYSLRCIPFSASLKIRLHDENLAILKELTQVNAGNDFINNPFKVRVSMDGQNIELETNFNGAGWVDAGLGYIETDPTRQGWRSNEYAGAYCYDLGVTVPTVDTFKFVSYGTGGAVTSPTVSDSSIDNMSIARGDGATEIPTGGPILGSDLGSVVADTIMENTSGGTAAALYDVTWVGNAINGSVYRDPATGKVYFTPGTTMNVDDSNATGTFDFTVSSTNDVEGGANSGTCTVPFTNTAPDEAGTITAKCGFGKAVIFNSDGTSSPANRIFVDGTPNVQLYTDDNSDICTPTITTPASNGTAGVSGSSILYVHDGVTDPSLGDTIGVTWNDGYLDSSESTWTLTITRPEANDDYYTVLANSSGNVFSVLINDEDSVGSGLTISDVDTTTTAGGTAAIASQTIIYTPFQGYIGPDSFTYEITDGNTDTDTATVFITVEAETITLTPQSLTLEVNRVVPLSVSFQVTADPDLIGSSVTYYKEQGWIDENDDGFTNGEWSISTSGLISVDFNDPNATGPFNFYWVAYPADEYSVGYGTAIVTLTSAVRPEVDPVDTTTGIRPAAKRSTAVRVSSTRITSQRTPRS